MTKIIRTVNETVFLEELKLRQIQFEELRKASVIRAEFSDNFWLYKGHRIRFRGDENGRLENKDLPRNGFSINLARCFAVTLISQSLSESHIKGLLYGLKIVNSFIGSEISSWISLSPSSLKQICRHIEATLSPRTAYLRENAIHTLIKYLNSIGHPAFGVYRPFVAKPINWHPELPNPIKSTLQRIATNTEHSRSKFVPNLHVSLGTARSRIKVDPSLELKPGYDLIRLESLAFSMALGLRIGEVATLPVNVLGTDEAFGQPFARVFTEKGELPFARPIPHIWAPLIAEATDYLLEQCADARARAREIEENGFKFVYRMLESYRKDNPLSRNRIAQLDVSGLPRGHYYFTDEVAACFKSSGNEPATECKLRDFRKKLPLVECVHALIWLDQRFLKWDWRDFSKVSSSPRSGQLRPYSISTPDLSWLSGTPVATIKRAWYFQELRDVLMKLNLDDVFSKVAPPTAQPIIKKHRLSWANLRKKMFSRDSRKASVIDVDQWVGHLQSKYHGYVERHRRELIADDGHGPNSKAFHPNPLSQRLSDSLIVLWEGQFHVERSNGILPRPIFRADFYNYICATDGRKTVFNRLGIKDNNQQDSSITPHQIRHWVTTAMLRSGPSEMMVDLWMGRRPGQSRHYDHRTATERAEAARARYTQAVVPDDFLGRKIQVWRHKKIPEAQILELVNSKLRVMHFVPWGACSRELYTSPCTRGLMCLRGFGTDSACESFHIDPNSLEEREAIVKLKASYEDMWRAINPSLEASRDALLAELNSSEALDQHIKFIADVIRGCNQALAAYAVGRQVMKLGPSELVKVSSMEGSS